jgi:hypothetical protein
MDARKAASLAIANISRHGDTDVYPHPIENHVFFDLEAESVDMLDAIENDFDAHLTQYPPAWENSLAVVGYTGFRSATQLDPMWNAYLLALVIGLGERIEAARIPAEREVIFSYSILTLFG